MNKLENRYYCHDSLKDEEEEKWQYLLDYAFDKADFVEFNLLYLNQQITPEIEALSKDLVEKSKRKRKIYSNGNYYVRYILSDKMKEFIKFISFGLCFIIFKLCICIFINLNCFSTYSCILFVCCC